MNFKSNAAETLSNKFICESRVEFLKSLEVFVLFRVKFHLNMNFPPPVSHLLRLSCANENHVTFDRCDVTC
jgi:hypothetical protein